MPNSSRRLSGILNNCILNAVLPTIFNVIEDLATREKNGTLPTDHPLYNNYCLLRKMFIKEYDLPETFTWREWGALLSKYVDNFFLFQLIFARVLRDFLAHFSPEKAAMIPLLQEGRFSVLNTHEAFPLYKPLGISLIEKSSRPEEFPDDVLNADVFINKVEVRWIDGHFDFNLSDSQMVRALSQEGLERGAYLKHLVPTLQSEKLGVTNIETEEQLKRLRKEILTSYKLSVDCKEALQDSDYEKVKNLEEEKYKHYVTALIAHYRLGLFKPASKGNSQIDRDEELAKRLQTEEIEAYLKVR